MLNKVAIFVFFGCVVSKMTWAPFLSKAFANNKTAFIRLDGDFNLKLGPLFIFLLVYSSFFTASNVECERETERDK